MFRDYVDAITSESVLADRQLLKALVVLEHLAKVDCYTLADCLVNWVVDVKLNKCLVA
jgi:hypothetical protein